ncbi:MAG: hypothetical protein PHC54_06070 [Candidatus Omnitrophica bacterium]|nr:hypothetical protein [Candidatus Omnitrophota bacterium]MDD5592764.1 hypothetical protein [Candidatus Omnitrophota bacterium]
MLKIKFPEKVLREIIIFAGIYAAWVVYINIKNPPAELNNDALVPCLFSLPPIGLYSLYFIVIRYIIFRTILSWIRKGRLKRAGKKVTK